MSFHGKAERTWKICLILRTQITLPVIDSLGDRHAHTTHMQSYKKPGMPCLNICNHFCHGKLVVHKYIILICMCMLLFNASFYT